jgi:hypothetical protein
MVTLSAPAADDGQVWMTWVLGGLAVWLVVAFLVAVVIGRSIRLADRRSPNVAVDGVLTTADLETKRRAAAPRARRRTIPVPPLGIALFAMATGLETCGYVVRLTGTRGPVAQVLSMDASHSLPRMFVAALFAAAALAAVAGAGRMPGRRTWWVAVGLVAGTIAAVKAGSSVHADALGALTEAVGATGALLLSVAAAASVLGALWVLSRNEQRDRRRVLGVLALYAGASVGLSAVSSVAARTYGSASNWAAAATFLEESGEALAGVAFLVAVLVGVAPRLVLPPAWVLRRTADAHTLELPEQLPGRAADGPARG